jgi:Reverse transcriptase (RNA-dependent DNA polymerase)
MVWRLRRALYGLRQAPRAWYMRLKAELERVGFAASELDPGLYSKRSADGEVAYVLVWVDDMLVTPSESPAAAEAVAALKSAFTLSVLGEPAVFLGMALQRDRAARTITLSQERYVHSTCA